jgi:hypothetical protein
LFQVFLTSIILFTVTQRVPLVEQDMFTLSRHLSSLPFFNWVHVTQILVFLFCLFPVVSVILITPC